MILVSQIKNFLRSINIALKLTKPTWVEVFPKSFPYCIWLEGEKSFASFKVTKIPGGHCILRTWQKHTKSYGAWSQLLIHKEDLIPIHY